MNNCEAVWRMGRGAVNNTASYAGYTSVLGHFKINKCPKKKFFSTGDWALVQNVVYFQN